MTAHRRSALSKVLAAAVSLVAVAALAQDVPLRYRWTEGEAIRYRTTTESTVAMSGLPGMGDMTVTNVMTQTYLMTTEKIGADGTATVRTLFEAIRMDTSSPAGNMTYDSATNAQPSDPAMAEAARMLGALVGESVAVAIAPDGTVRSVDGMAQIRKKVEGAAAASAALSLMGGGFDALMSDDAMRATFSQMFARLPDKAIKTGDSWTSEISAPNPAGTQTITNTLTLKGVERVDGRELTKISVTQTTKTTPGGAIGQITVEAGDGTGIGEVLFDHKLGRPERATMSATMPMTMRMSGPDGSSLSIQSATTTKTTVELVRR